MKVKIAELEKYLNEEYSDLGSLQISEANRATVKVDKIKYVQPFMKDVLPLKSDNLIIINSEHVLIDGYHRLKYYILNGIEEIEAIQLINYEIKRKHDNLLSFLTDLKGKTIKFLNNNNLKVEDKFYYIEENEGCGGCGNGWSSIEVKDKFIGVDIKIKSISAVNDDNYDDEYKLYINGSLIAFVNTGWGNGYYGGDFEIKIA